MNLVSRGAYEERVAESLVAHILAEITRLMPLARAEREVRLRELPSPAPVAWGEFDESDRSIPGTFHSQGNSIHVSLEIHLLRGLEASLTSARVTVTPAGVRHERVNRSWSTCVPVDGIIADATIEFLEMWGWPKEIASAIGRAIAIKARAEWIARQPLRDKDDAEYTEFLRAHWPKS
jgi:hypothetical protein